MDLSASALSALSSQQTGDAVGISVLKKALNAQAQGALALINAATRTPSASNLPPHLGQNINTTA